MNKNNDTLFLDVRGLAPPEPLEQVLDALPELAPGDTLSLLIDREPRPLYDILDANGYAYRTDHIDTCYQILIYHKY